ncbi:MAG: thermonuclease family protein, partial [Nitrospira sp.]|nr:thermonuclease family protein [Nitrospira sp.]
CPEKGQPFGKQAKQFTSTMVFGREVTVQVLGVDKYGRTIGSVLLGDGRSLNRELVRAGFAWWYRKHSTDFSLGDLEDDARLAKRGLWADPDPIPPWQWRKQRTGRGP